MEYNTEYDFKQYALLAAEIRASEIQLRIDQLTMALILRRL